MALESFINFLSLEKKYSKHTVTAYKADIKAFRSFCRDEYDLDAIDDVNYPMIRNWIVSLVNSAICNRSVNRKVASLKAYYKFLLSIGIIDINPLTKHRPLKTSTKIEIPFSKDEMKQMFSQYKFTENFEGIRDKLIIDLLYTTGIRRAELVHLKVSNVRLGESLIKVFGKRNKERIIPLLPEVTNQFKAYFDSRNKLNYIADNAYVFLLKSGNKIYGTFVYRIINSYFSKVSLKAKKSPHILRHTFATHMLNEGADLNSVKELLGHSSLASTQVYTHNSIAELKRVHVSAHPRGKKQ